MDSTLERGRVGGMWDLMGSLQFEFMVSAGLKPEHTLLDVGCGCFRGGVRFLPYLDDGNYVGLDKSDSAVKEGRRIKIPKAGIDGEKAKTIVNGDFDLSGYEGAFDYALAQSLFPHLQRDEIKRCVRSVCRALKPGGHFYASWFTAPGPQHDAPITHQPGGVKTYLSRDPFHQDPGFYEELAANLGIGIEVVGDWGHPRAQKMLGFAKAQ